MTRQHRTNSEKSYCFEGLEDVILSVVAEKRSLSKGHGLTDQPRKADKTEISVDLRLTAKSGLNVVLVNIEVLIPKMFQNAQKQTNIDKSYSINPRKHE